MKNFKISYIFISIIFTYGVSIFSGIVQHNSSLLVPPLIEELSKLSLLILNPFFAIIYTLVFSIIECLMYLSLILKQYDSIPIDLFILRIICVMNHFIYLSIQYIGFVFYKRYSQKEYILFFFLFAYSIHVFWNKTLGKLVYYFLNNLLGGNI